MRPLNFLKETTNKFTYFMNPNVNTTDIKMLNNHKQIESISNCIIIN